MIAVVFLLGWALIVQAGLADLAKFGGAMDAPILLFQILGWVALVGAGVAAWNAWLVWPGGATWWSRVWSIAMAASCALIVWFGFTFNLIGVRLHY